MRNPIAILLDLFDLPDEIPINLSFKKIEDLRELRVLHFILELLCQFGGVLLRVSRSEQLIRHFRLD